MKYTYMELDIMCIATSPQVTKGDHAATDTNNLMVLTPVLVVTGISTRLGKR